MSVNLLLMGYGNVGRHFASILGQNHNFYLDKYGLDLRLVGIINSSCGIYNKDGLAVEKITLNEGKLVYRGQHAALPKGIDGIYEARPDIMVDATPTNIEDGEPGVSYCMYAINNGIHLVLLSKGALVTAFNRMKEAASRNGVLIKFSGATAAALPVMDTASYCLAGCEIQSVSGILNGTSNYILTSMYEQGISYEEALSDAVSMGIAETNPSLDVDGWDTACKAVIISNGLMGGDIILKNMSVKGITHIKKEDMDYARASGKLIKLMASIEKREGMVTAEVGPSLVDCSSAFAAVKGTMKAVCFNTELMGTLYVIGGGSNPRAAAASAIKDVINLARENKITLFSYKI